MFESEEDCMRHHHFILGTDRKSLVKQLKVCVDKAKQNFAESLSYRREQLSKLLDIEDKVYEEEFANKVKSRIDEELQERSRTLYKIKEESTKLQADFLDSKRIQFNINNCYEIRQAFQRREREYVRIIQEEQISENERKIQRERQLEKYWLYVNKKNDAREQEQQRQENCLKKKFMEQVKFVLDRQLEEHAEKREEERKEKQKEIERIANLIEELRIEEFDEKIAAKGLPRKKLEYRKELLDSIEEHRKLREKELHDRAEEHRKMMAELRALECEENDAIRKAKLACRKATLEYIDYLRRMRYFEDQQLKQRNDRIEDLQRVDICTKTNLQRDMKIKAEKAAHHFDFLRKQMCEQLGRRMREEAERRELQIMENPYGRSEKTVEQIKAARRKHRVELDKQLEELRRIRAEEALAFEKGLMMASDDPVLCAALADKYINEGIDHLMPHANWRILGCPAREIIPKAPIQFNDIPPEGASLCAGGIPCGCATKPKMTSHMRRNAPGPGGDGP